MKKLRLILGMVLLVGGACQREGNFPEVTNMPVENSEEKTVTAGKMLAQMIFDSVAYTVQPEDMLKHFIKEFGDGTVVDKALIRRVQATKNDKPYYYAVGIGMKNGDFRMMALELYVTEDKSLYISPQSRKYITTSRDCDFCLFTYDNNVITGAECENRDAGDACSYTEEDSNSFMR